MYIYQDIMAIRYNDQLSAKQWKSHSKWQTWSITSYIHSLVKQDKPLRSYRSMYYNASRIDLMFIIDFTDRK